LKLAFAKSSTDSVEIMNRIASLLTLAGIPHRTPKRTKREEEIESRAKSRSMTVLADVEEYLANFDFNGAVLE